MGKSSLKLDVRKALKDGTYPVVIKVGYGTNLYLSTGIYVKEKEWNARTQMCTGQGARRMNNILGALLAQVQDRVLELREMGIFRDLSYSQLREMLLDTSLAKPTETYVTVEEMFQKLIASKTGKTAANYESTRKKLEAYMGDLSKVRFTDLTRTKLEGFQNSLSELKQNTRWLYVQKLKSVIAAAEEEGIPVNRAYRKISEKKEDTTLRALTLEQARLVRDAQVQGERFRDCFMLSFYLIGINPVDIGKLKKTDLKNGRLSYKRSKTGKVYSIKVEPEAQAIIDKYPGDGDKLVSFTGSPGFQISCNNHLDKIVSGCTMYYARYTWANFAVDLDIPKDTISECLGHEHGAKVTGIYIRYSLDKIDEANRKVIDYLNSDLKQKNPSHLSTEGAGDLLDETKNME